jgi:hypothetical protein
VRLFKPDFQQILKASHEEKYLPGTASADRLLHLDFSA